MTFFWNRAINIQPENWAVPDSAMKSKEVKDTPVQSQSERDKTVAGNESGFSDEEG